MRWLFNLSFRHKIPLWTSFLISFSILVIATALMARAYEVMKTAVVISADNLGHTIANTIAPTLLHDDVWRAFEIVRSPIRAESAHPPRATPSTDDQAPRRSFVRAAAPRNRG